MKLMNLLLKNIRNLVGVSKIKQKEVINSLFVSLFIIEYEFVIFNKVLYMKSILVYFNNELIFLVKFQMKVLLLITELISN